MLEEFQARIDNKLALMQFRFANVCTSSDPMSLLSVKIDCDGEKRRIEDVCDVVKEDEERLHLYPKDESLVENIMDGVGAEHPEFQQDIIPMRISMTSEAQLYTVLLTVPPVDQKRHDILIKAVDTYKDAFEKQIEVEKALFMVELAEKLLTASKEDKDEANKVLGDGIDEKKQKADQAASDKKKEIDEALERYLKNQASSDKFSAENLKAEDPSAAFSMKME